MGSPFLPSLHSSVASLDAEPLLAWQRASQSLLWSDSSSFFLSIANRPASCSGAFPCPPIVFHRHYPQSVSYASSSFLVCFLEDLTNTQLQCVSSVRPALALRAVLCPRATRPWQYLLLGFLSGLVLGQLVCAFDLCPK